MKGETIESLLPYRVVIYAKGVLTTTKYRVLQQTLNWLESVSWALDVAPSPILHSFELLFLI